MKKPVVNYVLESKSKSVQDRNLEELITARISGGWYKLFNGKKKYLTFKVSLQCRIKPNSFGKAENLYKFNEAVFQNYSKSNSGIKNKMRHLEKQIDKVYSHFMLNEQNPSKDEFQKELSIQLNKIERLIKENITIHQYLEKMISNFESLIGSAKRNELSIGRIRTFKTLLYYIEKYESYFQTKLFFETLTEKTYWEFWDFQDDILSGVKTIKNPSEKRKQQIKKNGFSINGINKYQKALILTCKNAKADLIDVALNLLDKNLILPVTTTAKDIYIDEENLKKIINYKSLDASIENAREYVIIASLTGMRYESMVDAHKEKIELYNDGKREFYYIHSDQGKTETECIIPLLSLSLIHI